VVVIGLIKIKRVLGSCSRLASRRCGAAGLGWAAGLLRGSARVRRAPSRCLFYDLYGIDKLDESWLFVPLPLFHACCFILDTLLFYWDCFAARYFTLVIIIFFGGKNNNNTSDQTVYIRKVEFLTSFALVFVTKLSERASGARSPT